MTKKINILDKSAGFTAIELLITLFIAAAFLLSGYQLFSVIIKDGGEARARAKATNIAYDYLQRYKSIASDPCEVKNPVTNETIENAEVADISVSVSVSCPYLALPSISKINVTLKYNTPQKIIEIATYNTGTCPTGYILVPGSVTYGTNDFCVMKYEAKADDNGDGIGDTSQSTGVNTWPAGTHQISATRKLVSSAQGYPVASINQTSAIATASNPSFVAGCTSGCHLINEAEWMTIAQNVLSVPSNWSSGIVGTGYIFSGHNDGNPNTALIADASGSDSYYLTGQSIGNQRRTLTLTNGEVIWDFAGNVFEWTSGQTNGTSAQQPGVVGNNYNSLIAWGNITTPGSLSINPSPYHGTAGMTGWTSTLGIGLVFSSTTDTALRGIIRGGGYANTVHAGIYGVDFQYIPSYIDDDLGLRVVKSI